MKRAKEKAQVIHTHKLGDRTDIGIEVRYIDPRGAVSSKRMGTPHRDDHFLFALQESGKSRLFVDFEEVDIRDCAVLCIQPGQVHYTISMEKAKGWLLSLSPLLVGAGPALVFEEQIHANEPLPLTGPAAEGIKACARLLYHQLQFGSPGVRNKVVPLLSGAFSEMVSNQYADRQSLNFKTRPRATTITSRFKALLVKNFRMQKAPAQYARALNYSLSHLNESVKSATGLPVSHWIQHQVLLEGRRLLYYSELSIKEIAASLGYEDQAYFSRLFTGKIGISPAAFRKKFRR